MNTGLAALAATVLLLGAAYAQGTPSGHGAVTGDPAASSSTPHRAPTTGAATRPSRSGSGTSTSGGSDDNGDQGRDRMPESDRTVGPGSQQHHPNDKQ